MKTNSPTFTHQIDETDFCFSGIFGALLRSVLALESRATNVQNQPPVEIGREKVPLISTAKLLK